MTLLPAILLSGIATYLTRALPLVAALRPPADGPVRRYLDLLPASVIAALAGAAVIAPDDRLTSGAEPIAAVVAVALALWRRNMLLAVLGGTATIAALRELGVG